eukprot:4715796-Amphidinium_carterae.1
MPLVMLVHRHVRDFTRSHCACKTASQLASCDTAKLLTETKVWAVVGGAVPRLLQNDLIAGIPGGSQRCQSCARW